MGEVGYTIGDHPSDLELYARGRDRKDLFVNAARGVMDYTVPSGGTGRTVTCDIHLTASDLEELLVLWLNEIIYLLETEEARFKIFTIHHLSDREMRATLKGARLTGYEDERGPEIKAATYHQLSVGETETGWEARVILDI